MSKISVIIPLYNKAKYILATIESVMSQTYDNWEMLIIDNGSTDGGFEIAKQAQDSRISFLECSKQGPSATRNYGLNYARGEWVQFLDADDLLLPNHFQQQLKIAEQNCDAKIVVCCWQEFQDSHPELRTLKKPAGMNKSPEFLVNTAIAFTPWPPHTALVKREILKGEFLWLEEMDYFLAEDTPFWFRLINKYKIIYNEQVGVLYRSQVSQSRTNFQAQKWFEGLHKAVSNNLDYIQDKYLVSAEQGESIMRLYSGIYIIACQQKSADIQEKSLQEATKWLQFYFQKTKKYKPSMIFRYLLGIKLFMVLKNLKIFSLLFTNYLMNSIKKNLGNLFFKLYYGFQGVPFQINRETIRLDESLRRWNIKAEAGVHDIIREYLNTDDIFIDVGANFGLHTVYAAKLVGDRGRVFAFEPVSNHLNLLHKNLNLSHVKERVEIVSTALSNSTESSLNFYLPIDEDIAVTASLNTDGDNLEKIEVANTRLDDYWNNIDRAVKLIKIDVEGAELEVLRGAEKLLKKWKPKLLIEVHGFALPSFGTSVAELRKFLGELGYRENRLEGENFRGEDYFQALYI